MFISDGIWSDFPEPEDVSLLSKHLAKCSPPKVSQPIETSAQTNLHSLTGLSSSPPSNNNQISAHQALQSQLQSDYLGSQQSNYPSIQASLLNGSQNSIQYGSHNGSYNDTINGHQNQSHNGSHNMTSSKPYGTTSCKPHNTNSSKPPNATSAKLHGCLKTQNNSHQGSQSGRTNMDHEYHEISDEEEAAALEVSLRSKQFLDTAFIWCFF